MTVAAERLARRALDWLLGCARDVDGDLWWASTPSDDELNPMLYSGAAGIVLALLEGQRHFGDRYGDAAVRATRSIAAACPGWVNSSLHFGVTGMAFALWAVGDRLGDATAAA
ncbi:MAG TPA: lanthionine synthetase LanC family protein, partial [Pseudonocardiaceae bacterium]|nr:lanthionine synthetase LanC family protein [Pseudonocardiaceae bacterium]